MASDELKNVLVSATQGGLNLDDDIHAIPDGDGRERRNIMIGYDGSNGLVEPILGYEKITFPVSGATYHGGDSDVDGNLYLVYSKTGTYYVYRYRPNVGPLTRWSKILETTDVLFNTSNYVHIKYGDGYVFITQDGYAPLMIDVDKNHTFSTQFYKAKISYMTYDGMSVEVRIPHGVYCPVVGDEVSFVFDSISVDIGAFNGTGTVTQINKDILGSQYGVVVNIDNETDIGAVNGYLLPGSTNYASFIENLTTARPVPQMCADVEMISDPSLGYNKFSESLFTFGYSFVYDDGYETIISPLSPPDITRLAYDSSYRTNIGTLYNKARITIRPYSGVDKVRIYAKKDNPSESFYRVVELDITTIGKVQYDWDGVLVEDVLDNSVWAKGSEAIPLSAKVMEYLPDERVAYGVCDEGYELSDVKFFAAVYKEEYNLAGDSYYKATSLYMQEGTWIHWNDYQFLPLGWDTAAKDGKFIFNFYVNTTTIEGNKDFLFTVEKDINYGITSDNFMDSIVIAINDKYNSYPETETKPGLTVTRVGDNLNIWFVHNSSGYFKTVTGTIQLISKFADKLYSKHIKEKSNEQFGVVFYDKYNRSAAYTNPSGVYKNPGYYTNNTAFVWKAVLLLGGTVPSWAVSYQFIVKRNLNSWSQHIIPNKFTYGSWGSSGTVDSKAIKHFYNNIYGIAFNKLIGDNVNENSALIYQYKEGDYCRFIKHYNTNGWWARPDENMYRITGVKTDDDGTYFLIEDTDGNFDETYNAYYLEKRTNTSTRYLQFEIINVGTLTLDESEVWTEISERFSCVNGFSGIPVTAIYPEDREAGWQPFYNHGVDYGNCLYRNIYRGNLDLEIGWDESMFYLESQYLYDSSNTRKLINVGRPHVVNKNKNNRRNIVRHGGKKFDGTDVDNRRVFDYDDYELLNNEVGELTGMATRGNVLRLYCPHKTASIYLNAVEGSLPDGTTNYVYTDRVFGTMRWSNDRYGCSDEKSIVEAGDSIYFYDSRDNDIIRDTIGGMIPIAGKISVGENSYDGKMKSFLTGSVVMGYNPKYRQLFITRESDKATVWYSEIYNRWMSYLTIQPTDYIEADNDTWSVAGIYLFKHHQSGSNTYNSSGATSTSNSVFDIVVGQDRAVNKLFEAVVQHVNNKQDVYLKSYSKDWSSYMYTKIPRGIFKKWDDVFYSDITKGIKGLSSNFRTAMMYEGDDMIGKVGVFKIDTSEDFNLSALEVRYVLLNK